ncbi:MAG: hypothetical protein RMA76_04550 [Deltaproteobacteria bacterium]
MNRIARTSLLSITFALAACGGDDDAGFEACGGDPVAGWDLVAAEFEAAQPDGCTGGVSGTVFFNPNGRYSINLDIQAWKKTGGASEACGFTAVYGGFYRVQGSTICFGDSSAEGDAIPCDGTRPTQLHATAEFCVEGGLALRTSTFQDPRVSTVLRFDRRP